MSGGATNQGLSPHGGGIATGASAKPAAAPPPFHIVSNALLNAARASSPGITKAQIRTDVAGNSALSNPASWAAQAPGQPGALPAGTPPGTNTMPAPTTPSMAGAPVPTYQNTGIYPSQPPIIPGQGAGMQSPGIGQSTPMTNNGTNTGLGGNYGNMMQGLQGLLGPMLSGTGMGK